MWSTRRGRRKRRCIDQTGEQGEKGVFIRSRVLHLCFGKCRSHKLSIIVHVNSLSVFLFRLSLPVPRCLCFVSLYTNGATSAPVSKFKQGAHCHPHPPSLPRCALPRPFLPIASFFQRSAGTRSPHMWGAGGRESALSLSPDLSHPSEFLRHVRAQPSLSFPLSLSLS